MQHLKRALARALDAHQKGLQARYGQRIRFREALMLSYGWALFWACLIGTVHYAWFAVDAAGTCKSLAIGMTVVAAITVTLLGVSRSVDWWRFDTATDEERAFAESVRQSLAQLEQETEPLVGAGRTQDQ